MNNAKDFTFIFYFICHVQFTEMFILYLLSNQKIVSLFVLTEFQPDNFLRLLVIVGGAFFLVIISVKFQKFHNVEADRISAIEKASFLFADQACSGSTTAFSVSLNKTVFSVTAAHIECASSCPDSVVHCDGPDIALILKCPASKNALDGSQFVESRIGDDVYVRGYSDINVNNYKASVGGTCGEHIENDPFAGKAIVRANYRYLIGGSQSLGLSGSCVLNGYGIVGVAVAVAKFESPHILTTSLVVPWSDVVACFHKKQETHKFPSLSSCNMTMSYVPSLLNKAEAFISNSSRHSFFAETANTLYHFL